MKNNTYLTITYSTLITMICLFATLCFSETNDLHDDHDHIETEIHDLDHESDGHSEDEEHDHESEAEHDHEHSISLDEFSEKLIGLKTIVADKGEISMPIELTGQVSINEDNLAHIVPMTSGIVRKVNNQLGDVVAKDATLAWLESMELAETKVRYMETLAEIGCSEALLERIKTVKDNTLKLIELLKNAPHSLDNLQNLTTPGAGDNHKALVKAYADYVSAETIFQREKKLYEQNISSQQEYINAENTHKSTQAEYLSLLNTLEFQVKQDHIESQVNLQRQHIVLKGIERILYVLGQNPEDIDNLHKMVDAISEEKANNSLPAPETFTKLGWYPLKAGSNGTIIDKHITTGERLSENDTAFTVADLSTLWVDLEVFSKDLPDINTGQKCTITYAAGNIDGNICYISPILDNATRTAVARVIISNSGALKPGMFVKASVNTHQDIRDIVIPRKAIQNVEGKNSVFVKEDGQYELRPVITGNSNSTHIEILSGLAPGEIVVTDGAFDLKAKIVTSTLDSHAGHGH